MHFRLNRNVGRILTRGAHVMWACSIILKWAPNRMNQGFHYCRHHTDGSSYLAMFSGLIIQGKSVGSSLQIKIKTNNPAAYKYWKSERKEKMANIHWVLSPSIDPLRCSSCCGFFFCFCFFFAMAHLWWSLTDGCSKWCPWSGIFKRIYRVSKIQIIKISLPQRGWVRLSEW